MGASNWHYLEVVRIIKITDKAMLVELEDQQLWIPLSQIEEGEWEEGDENVEFGVTEWFAKKEGLI